MWRRLGVALMAVSVATAQNSIQELVEQKTLRELRAYEEKLDAVLGVAVIDLQTGRSFHLNGNVVFAQASMIKVPILVELYRAVAAGSLSLDEKVTLTRKDVVPGSGRIQRKLVQEPLTLTLRELAAEMIEFSDNTAANTLIRRLSMDAINRNLERLGFQHTRLQRVMLDSAAALQDRENISTPLEMARLFQLLWRNELPGSQEMLEMLKTVAATFRSVAPENYPVAAKPGRLAGVRGESGIIFLPHRPFALAVMSAGLSDLDDPVPGAVRIVLSNFEKLDRSNLYGHRVR